jgi:acetyl-CoA C-acetyltransferase
LPESYWEGFSGGLFKRNKNLFSRFDKGEMMSKVLIVSATRTFIRDFGGSLKDVSAISLAMKVINSSIQRVGIEKKSVEQVITGNCFEPLDQNVAKIAAVKCGFPLETPGFTIAVNCAPGIHAMICGT